MNTGAITSAANHHGGPVLGALSGSLLKGPHLWTIAGLPALAITAALIGGIGVFCGAITNVMVFPNLAAATTHMPPAAAAQFLVTTFNSGFGHAFFTPMWSHLRRAGP